jgi:hypothetical protein
MQHARKYLPWLLFANLWVATANAAPVPSLYAAVVPEADPQRSAQLAMREVLVRLTGSRTAADDPAFAALIEDAKRYVQLERNTTHAATQVIFDATSLQAAIATAGGKVWDPDRPLVWVVLPVAAGAAADDLRAQLNAAAQNRGGFERHRRGGSRRGRERCDRNAGRRAARRRCRGIGSRSLAG